MTVIVLASLEQRNATALATSAAVTSLAVARPGSRRPCRPDASHLRAHPFIGSAMNLCATDSTRTRWGRKRRRKAQASDASPAFAAW
jgi:hypothetical protein